MLFILMKLLFIYFIFEFLLLLLTKLQILIKIDFNKVQSKGYSFFMEIVYLLIKLNYKIKEIPIIFKVRRHGVSKIDKIELLRTFFNAFRLYINKIYY
jgi:hypothetical protein